MLPLVLSLILFHFSSSTLASPYYPYYLPKQQRTCATADPEDDLLAQHSYLQDQETQDNALWNSSMIQNRYSYSSTSKRSSFEPLYTIDTYFHVVLDSNSASPGSAGYVTDQMLSDQLAYLTAAYKPTGIAFNLIGTTRTVNDTWARNGDDMAMKASLRRGTYSTLNVYYQTMLQAQDENGVPNGDTLIGFCTLPTPGITSTTLAKVYVQDGCNVLSGTLPGSYESDYNLGGTSAHEIGHWNGLLHPFQGNTCSQGDYGDYVADTPQERTETSGCPEQKDTCPTSGVDVGSYDGSTTQANPYTPQGYAGLDPIHNYMDYSQDSCYEGFTAGQAARMVNMWVIYRMGL